MCMILLLNTPKLRLVTFWVIIYRGLTRFWNVTQCALISYSALELTPLSVNLWTCSKTWNIWMSKQLKPFTFKFHPIGLAVSSAGKWSLHSASCGCGTWGQDFLMNVMVMLGWWFGFIMLKIFSSLNNSMILWFCMKLSVLCSYNSDFSVCALFPNALWLQDLKNVLLNLKLHLVIAVQKMIPNKFVSR